MIPFVPGPWAPVGDAAWAAADERLLAAPAEFRGSRFGAVLAAAGDADADGFVDVAIGAPDDGSSRSPGKGQVWVLSGYDDALLFHGRGSLQSERYGAALSALGDVNHDGHADLAVGAPGFDAGRLQEAGRVLVLSGASGCVLAELRGKASHDNLGASLAALADCDGDGAGELAIGVPGADGTALGAGAVWLVDSAALGVWQVLDGRASLDAFGSTLAALGDLDLDGEPDLAVGAPFADPRGESSGRVAVIAALESRELFALLGQGIGEKSGLALARAGDLDADGLADVAVGAPFARKGGTARYGRVEIHRGRGGQVMGSWYGESIDDRFGWSIVPVGDVDGDGVNDLAVGAPWSDDGGERSGEVSVRSGKDGRVLVEHTRAAPGSELGTAVAAWSDWGAPWSGGPLELALGAPGEGKSSGSTHLMTIGPLRSESALALSPSGGPAEMLLARKTLEPGARLALAVVGGPPGAALQLAANPGGPPRGSELELGLGALARPVQIVFPPVRLALDGRLERVVTLPENAAIAGVDLCVQALVQSSPMDSDPGTGGQPALELALSP